MDRYEEHLADSAPCSSRWDGFDRGDGCDQGIDVVTETVIGRMTNPRGQRVVVAEIDDGYVFYGVSVDNEYVHIVERLDQAIELARSLMR